MALILDGKVVRDEIAERLRSAFSALADKPTLAIVVVGDRADSAAYVRQKELFAGRVGARVMVRRFPEAAPAEEVLAEIRSLNADASVHGIIVQLPLPARIDPLSVVAAIAPEKDVDGLAPENVERLAAGKGGGFVPATARGVMTLLDRYGIDPAGKRALVIGRSFLVGKPIALSLLARNATVTVAHRGTSDLAAACADADIVVVAAGAPGLVGRRHVHAGQTIVDVGLTMVPDSAGGKGKATGDVVFEEVEPIVGAISPVPGGVGPMTVASLFQNLADAYTKAHI